SGQLPAASLQLVLRWQLLVAGSWWLVAVKRTHVSHSFEACRFQEASVLPRSRHRLARGARQQFRRGARALQPAHQSRDADAQSRAARSLAQGRCAGIRHSSDSRRPRAGGSAGGGSDPGVVSRARDVVEVIARALADQPDAVTVTERENRGQTVVELTMAPGDMGRVIGRQGRTAQALRTLASAAAEFEGQKVTVDFRD